MDVAAVFLRMLQLPVIRNRLEVAAERSLTEIDCQRLAALAYLHDIGKLHPGFQAKGWPEELKKRVQLCGHTRESWEFLKLAFKWSEHPFHGTAMRMVEEWGAGSVNNLLEAMFSHHGRPVDRSSTPTLSTWDQPSLAHYDWRTEAKIMDAALHEWFAGAFEPNAPSLPKAPKFHHACAGFAALADWIGSSREFFEFSSPYSADYDGEAHRRAERALTEIGFDATHLASLPAPGFPKLTGFATPNPAQAAVGQVGTDARLVILEAETGSGKTEAALWRFAQLLATGKVSSLYFAVPTRAAAKQLQVRIDAELKRGFGKTAPEAVLAIPGMLKAGDYKGQRLPNWRVQWDDCEISVPHRWAAEHATRFLAATVAVGTVDQAMLGALQVKHAHMRGSALSRSLLVVDEVHASDAYMTKIIKQLLDDHLATGGYAMLMSATLGASARASWLDVNLPTHLEAAATPYPAVWLKGEIAPIAVAATGRHSKAVQMETRPTMCPKATAKLAIRAAEQDARVLIVRNTVDVAVETWRQVQEMGSSHLLLQVAQRPAVHHSRFAAEDRALLDQAVESALAPDKNRATGGRIVIGTQTLEQSLDIDADYLISDLCPIDVLLQRIGRLHRHSLGRPDPFREPRASVLLPDKGLDWLTKSDFENGLGAWRGKDRGINGIYLDLAVLELTKRLIQQNDTWRIPEMNRALVEGATHPDLIEALNHEKGETWQSYNREISGAEAAQAMVANLNCLDRQECYLNANFPSSDERVLTRLGEEGMVVTFPNPTNGPFDRSIARIALPARWSQGLNGKSQVAVTPDSELGTLTLTVGERRFRYSTAGLDKIQKLSGYSP